YSPRHLWILRRELGAYTSWSLGRKLMWRDRQGVPGMNPRLAEHVSFALAMCQRHATDLSAAMRKHQLKLADRQCRMSELSLRVQDTIVMLVTGLWGQQQAKETSIAAADVLCQDLRRKLTGERPADRYFRDVSQLADRILAGGFDELAGIRAQEILMPYGK